MSLDEIEITAISHGGVKGTYIERSKTAGGRRGWEQELVLYHLSLFYFMRTSSKMMIVRCIDVMCIVLLSVLTDYKPMLSLNETLVNLVFLLERLVSTYVEIGHLAIAFLLCGRYIKIPITFPRACGSLEPMLASKYPLQCLCSILCIN